jgi:hypothetical protein
VPISETDQFWQYAKEATLSACYAQNGQDKQSLLELARIWTQAALQERASTGDHDTAAEAIAT